MNIVCILSWQSEEDSITGTSSDILRKIYEPWQVFINNPAQILYQPLQVIFSNRYLACISSLDTD